MGINGLPGAGPWKILAECPASNHNTVSAARASHHGRTRPRCICPRGVDLHEAWKKKQNEGKPERRKKNYSIALSKVKPVPIKGRTVPDLRAGLCRSPEGRRIAEGGNSEYLTLGGMIRRQTAKDQCGRCPVKKLCKEWVLADEKPAGSWGGVYGGLDPWNRMGKQVIMIGCRAELADYDIERD